MGHAAIPQGLPQRRRGVAASSTLLSLLVWGWTVFVGPPAAAQQNTDEAVLSLKVEVKLVTLNVSVSGRDGRPYPSLKADNFRVYDNGIEQAIQHFAAEDRPYTLGLVLDRSGSMMRMIEEVYQAAFHTILASKLEDEFFVVSFNDGYELRQGLSSDRDVLQRSLKRVTAQGATAMYDAIWGAMDYIRDSRHDKKVLLVVTDGADNFSRHSFREVLERARSQNVAIYTVGMFDRMGLLGENVKRDALEALLTELAETTGGRAYFPRTVEECRQACIAIAEELRLQYAVGFYPRPKPRSSDWHAVQVQLHLDEPLAELGLQARTRAGYYAEPVTMSHSGR